MINKVIISDDLINYLETRKLEKQYIKAKNYLLKGNFKQIDFKLREPKKDKIYYFRINTQFRAFCKLEGNILKVFDIDNHQN
ncbi:MAG: hypothetical protein PHR68_03270 [Candidatus Gracilibacteria bacterium]|nr:hypothetical protein [Candidatus Gracilibacteria bacterium]